jgi:hypothetical protein
LSPTLANNFRQEGRQIGANEPVYFDLDTVLLLREALEDAWACLRPEQRATMSRTLLAERILKSAAAGECVPESLVNAALMAVVAQRLRADRSWPNQIIFEARHTPQLPAASTSFWKTLFKELI